MSKRNRDPAGIVRTSITIVGEETAFTRGPFEFCRCGGDVIEIQRKQSVAVAFGDFEREASFLIQRILNRLDLVGPGNPLAVEDIVDGVIRSDGEGDSVGGFGAGEGETAAGGGVMEGVKVESDVAVEFVEVDGAVAVEFRDVEIRERGEEILKGFIKGMEKREELGREDVLKDSEKA